MEFKICQLVYRQSDNSSEESKATAILNGRHLAYEMGNCI